MDKIKRLPLRDFTRYCMSIAAVPSSYLAGLSFEEQMLWLCSFITDEVIPAVNNNGGAVEELQALYVELKNYVDNYFDNLDIQEEVNTKLEEMAESGQLTDIIAQYIELRGVLAYNNANEMKNADNLVNGSIARTLGFYDYNDGGGSYYKIRTITNDDIIDNITIIPITNSDDLIAELLISNDIVNVKCYGAKGDGIHDDTLNIQKCLEDNTDKTVTIPAGKYKITNSLNTYMYNENPGNIILDNMAEIFTENNLDCILYLGNGTLTNPTTTDKDGVFRLKSHIKGGIINAKNCVSGIKLNNNCADIYIEDMKILYFNTYGVYIPSNLSNASSNCHFIKVEIDGNSSSIENYGFYIERPDNKFNDIIINSVRECFRIKYGGQFINNVHALMVGYDEYHQPLTNYSEWYVNTRCIYIENGAGTNIINQFFNDTFCTFIETSNDNNNDFTLTNSASMSYISGVNQKLFIFNQDSPKFVISNNNFELNTPDTKHQGIIMNNFDSVTITNNTFYLNNNTFNQTDRLVNGDLLLKVDNSYTPFWLNSQTDVPTDKWLLIGYTVMTTFAHKKFSLSIDNNLYEVIFRLDHYDDSGDSVGNVISGTSIKNNNIGMDIGFKYINHTNGYYIAGIYIKAAASGTKCNVDISNLNNSCLISPINQYKLDPNIFENSVDRSYTL